MAKKWDKYKKTTSKWGKYKVTAPKTDDFPVGNISIPESSRIAYVHNNPGNLMFTGQEGAERGEPKEGGGYWAKFENPQKGFDALVKDIQAKQQGRTSTGLSGDSTVADFISIYAPPNENETAEYIKGVTESLQISPDQKFSEVESDKLAREIARRESGTLISEGETDENLVAERLQKETAKGAPVEELSAWDKIYNSISNTWNDLKLNKKLESVTKFDVMQGLNIPMSYGDKGIAWLGDKLGLEENTIDWLRKQWQRKTAFSDFSLGPLQPLLGIPTETARTAEELFLNRSQDITFPEKQAEIAERRQEIEVEKKETGNILEGIKNGDPGEIAAGAVAGTLGFVPSLLVGLSSGGIGFVPWVTGMELNRSVQQEAQMTDRQIKEVFEQGDANMGTAIFVGTATGLLERMKFNYLTKYLGSKEIGKSFSQKFARMVGESGRQGFINWLEAGLMNYTDSYTKLDSERPGENLKNIEEAAKQSADFLWSDDGFEAGLKAMAGSFVLGGGKYVGQSFAPKQNANLQQVEIGEEGKTGTMIETESGMMTLAEKMNKEDADAAQKHLTKKYPNSEFEVAPVVDKKGAFVEGKYTVVQKTIEQAEAEKLAETEKKKPKEAEKVPEIEKQKAETEQTKEAKEAEKLQKKETIPETSEQKKQEKEVSDAEKTGKKTKETGEQAQELEQGEEGQVRVRGDEIDRVEAGQRKERAEKEGKEAERVVIPSDVLKQANTSFNEAKKNMTEADASIESWKAVERSDWFKKKGSAEKKRIREYYGNEITENFTKRPTEPKKREKTPMQKADGKVTIESTKRKELYRDIKTLARGARKGAKITKEDFNEASNKIVEKLKEGVDNKHINRGQYRAIVNRLGSATTELRRERLFDYVDDVLTGSEYKGLVQEANKQITRVKKANKKDRSKFGDAAELATKFTNIDPKQLTIEELQEFNNFAEGIMKNKKAPSVSYMETLVSKFSDNYRDSYDSFSAKIEKAKQEGNLDDVTSQLKKEMNEDISVSEDLFKAKNLKTAQDYIAAERKLKSTRKKVNRLLDEGLIEDEEVDVLIKKLGDKDDISGEWESKLTEFREDYAEQLADLKNDSEVKEALEELSEQERQGYEELLQAKKDQLNKLKIIDLEAFSNVIANLKNGYVIPEAFQLRRRLSAINKKDSFLGKAVSSILGSKKWGRLSKKGLKDFDKTIGSLKSHRIDVFLGNTQKYNTIGSIYYSVARAIQKESIENKNFEDKRLKILDNFHKKFLTKQEYAIMKASPGSKIGKSVTPEKIAKMRDKASNKIKEIQNFLIERSWQQEPFFKEGDINEKNASILNARYNDKNPQDKGVNDLESFYKERDRWAEQLQQAKEKGLTKKINGVEIIDVEKYEADLRKNKAVSDLLDAHDEYYESVKPFIKVATMENGRTFIDKEKYTPYRKKETGGRVDVNEIKAEIEGGIINPKMQANSTHNRKGIIQWLENDMFKIMDNHTKEAMRNYYVYPESRASLEALRDSFGEYLAENKDNFEPNQKLRDVLMADLKDRAARYYNSGKYAIEYDPVFDRWLKGAKKGMLVNPARIPSEMIANAFRATIAMGEFPTSAFKMTQKEQGVYDSLMKEYINEKYWSRYSPEIGGMSTKRNIVSQLEKGADWVITVSDKAIGRPMMRAEFQKAFKDLTGENFNPKEYAENREYALKHKDNIHKSATWAVRRLEELFNDKSVLTTPKLTRFIAGKLKANPKKTGTKLFDLFQSFNRNELDQVIDSARRISTGDPMYVKQGMQDIMAVMTSNVLYQVIRRSLGIAASVGLAKLLGQDLTDWEEEEKEMLLSREEFLKDIRQSEIGLLMGGSSNIYGYAGRIGMFVMEKSDVLDEDQKQYIYEILVDDLYGKKISEYGSTRSALIATLPVPNTAISDAFKGTDGLAAFVSSVYKAFEGGEITEKQMYEMLGLTNLIFKYFAPNPVTPTAQKVIDRQVREMEDTGKSSAPPEYRRPNRSTGRGQRSTPRRPNR